MDEQMLLLTLLSLSQTHASSVVEPEHGFCTRDCLKDADNYMAFIPGGDYFIGTNQPVFAADGEGPERSVSLHSFYIDVHEVSNQRFNDFVRLTGHISEAEEFGNSFVLLSLIEKADVKEKLSQVVAGSPWWVPVNGSTWRTPEGPGSHIGERMEHPVVHVSWNDAVAFCGYHGLRLPTEAEWEVACRGGLRDRLFPWGNKWQPRGEHRANTWQGSFPDHDSGDDGFVGTAPVHSFPANKYGVKNMVGNAWEWTQDDWSVAGKIGQNEKVKRGGSFMCHKNYCFRHRCAARSQNTADSTASNLGFRCARDP